LQTLKETIKAVSIVVSISLALAIAMAICWGCLEWMRNFPSRVPVLPDFFHTKTDYQAPPVTAATPLEAMAIDFMNWYNITFIGATRFGSALGIIAGAIWSCSLVRVYPRAARLCAGLVAGAFIGSRLAQILGPFPRTFIVATICGATLGALSMALPPSRIPPLPEDGADEAA